MVARRQGNSQAFFGTPLALLSGAPLALLLCASLAVASCESLSAKHTLTAWQIVTNLLSPTPPVQRDPVSMRLIEAGFGRTGTVSLKAALTELGYQVATKLHPDTACRDAPHSHASQLFSPRWRARACEGFNIRMPSFSRLWCTRLCLNAKGGIVDPCVWRGMGDALAPM